PSVSWIAPQTSLIRSRGALARRRSGRRLAGLAANLLAGVLDSLALIGLGRPQLPHLGRHRSDKLPIRAFERDHHLPVDLGGHARRKLINDWMRIAKRKMNIVAANLGPITYAAYLEHPGEALAYALGHIGDELAHQPVQRALALRIARPLHLDLRVAHL